MKSDFITEKQIRTLEKPEYFDILLEILVGDNYASKIARHLEKKQPTITEQLKNLEILGIIETVKMKGGAKRYQVNFDAISNYVYAMIEELRDIRLSSEYIGILSTSR